MSRQINNRILVIDDEESVRDSFQTILTPTTGGNALQSAAAALFGEPRPAAPADAMAFRLTCVSSGRAGVEAVREANRQGDPFAVIFCDIRMPGLDGVETIEQIRLLDRRAEVVFITAYSDHSIETITERAGGNVGYFVKPFQPPEVHQLATKLVLDWNRARELESLTQSLTQIRPGSVDTHTLIRHLLGDICLWMETDSAALFRVDRSGTLVFALGVGALADRQQAEGILPAEGVPMDQEGFLQLSSETILLRLPPFGVAVVLAHRARLTPDRRYLLQVFLQHTALAIQHNEALERLIRSERLSFVGQLAGQLFHDVRGPITVASCYAELMMMDQDQLSEVHQQNLNGIQLALHQTCLLLEDTVSVCRGEITVTPEVLDVREALADSEALVRLYLKRSGIALHIEIPDGLEIRVDADRLGRMVWNLVKNAADALHSTDSPSIVLRALSFTEEGRAGVLLQVDDNGPGVPGAFLEHLFEPLATQGKKAGTGFGLVVVQQIAMAHGGFARYQRLDSLSRFEVFFPDEGPPESR